MTVKKTKKGGSLSSLRKKAETKLRKQDERVKKLSGKSVRDLVHELGTHQIELEMQNEELRRAQEEIEASRSRYADLFDFAPVGYFTLDKNGLIVEVNLRGAEMLGITRRFLLRKSFTDFIPERADHGIFHAHRMAVLRTQDRQTCDITLRGKNDPSFAGHLVSRPVEGRAGHSMTAVIDISQRRRAEEALRESEQKFFLLFQKAGFGVALATSPAGVFIDVNEAAEKMFGYSRQEVAGKTSLDLGLHPDPDVRTRIFAELFEQNGVRDTEVKMRVKSGEERFFLTNIIPMDFGGRKYHIVTLVDITGRKRAEETLKTAHAELERRAYELEVVNRQLEAFSYTVSHDLKAPLRSIDGFARALLEDFPDKLDATGKDYLARINSAALRMNQLIDSMLDMARLTRGELHQQTVDLGSLAQIAANDVRKQDPERRVEFIIAEKAKVKADREMMMIVLQNLLDNAWKFTKKHAAAKIEFGAVEKGGRTVYFVRDDGAGFDMRYAEKLFMPFCRFHSKSEFPGLGIGLAIAHRIIMRHGGRMWAESAVEKGATFYFTL